jgi:hypothetical protein
MGSSVFVPPPVTRFAPSPTGYLHLGHVVNAIYVWGLARASGGRVILRIEDHDRLRCRPQYEAALLEDLDWLGFTADEGRHPPARQSDRPGDFADALDRLDRQGLVYACECSRNAWAVNRTTAAAATAASRANRGAACACASTASPPGDLLIRDRDGCWTYQFASPWTTPVQGVTLGRPGARPGRLHRTAGGAGAAPGAPGAAGLRAPPPHRGFDGAKAQ